MRLRCERLKFNLVRSQPFPIGMLLGEVTLDLLIVDDSALSRVDKEHPTGTETAFLNNSCRIYIDDSDL